ncbi:MAG: hypothetical protein ACRCWB_11645 [Enterovibrio sp.]
MATFIIKCGEELTTIEAKTLTAAKAKATKVHAETDKAAYEAAVAASAGKMFVYNSLSLAVLDENGNTLAYFGCGVRIGSAGRWYNVEAVEVVETAKPEEAAVEPKTEEFKIVLSQWHSDRRVENVVSLANLDEAKLLAEKMHGENQSWASTLYIVDKNGDLASQRRTNLGGVMVWMDYVEHEFKKHCKKEPFDTSSINSLRDNCYRGASSLKTVEIAGKARTDLVSANGGVSLAMPDKIYVPVTFHYEGGATIGKPSSEVNGNSYPVTVGALNALNNHFNGGDGKDFVRVGFVYTRTGAVVVTERNAESLGEAFHCIMVAKNQ